MNEIIATVLIASMGVYSVTFMPDYDKASPSNAPVVLSDDSFLSSDTPFARETPRELPPAPVPEPRPETKNPVSQPVVQENRTTEIEAPTVFGLKDCRQTQSEDSHHTEKGGHSFALDLACVRGVSYDVPAPHFKDFYVIEKIDFEARLGNYLILKHGDERYVYGHTQTSRKVGERVQAGDIIGQSNNSGHSFGVHTHAEYWSGKANKTFDGKRTNEYSKTLCTQRGWDFCKKEVLSKSEGLETYYFTHYDLGDISQNDASPCHGASGANLCFLAQQGVNTMALTADIRKKLGVKFGDKVILEGGEGCRGIYEVHDEMAPRFRNSCTKRPGTNYCIKGDLPGKPGGACTVQKINY